MSHNYNKLPILIILSVATIPIFLMYIYLILDTFTDTDPGSIIPNKITLEHWRFLVQNIEGKISIWLVTLLLCRNHYMEMMLNIKMVQILP